MSASQEGAPAEGWFAMIRRLQALRSAVFAQNGCDARQGLENRRVAFDLGHQWRLDDESQGLLLALNDLDRSFAEGASKMDQETNRARCLSVIDRVEKQIRSTIS